MTNEDRIKALEALGYDREEAQFLVLVALHAGYFVRRQYLAFVNCRKGSRDDTLIKKLVDRGHGEVSIFRQNRMVYHLGAKPLYDAIGQEDNRNRRERQPATIKNKLMGLDFVLENPRHQYLATEREKLDYFLTTRQLREAILPTRWYASPHGRGATAKHFVDKYPLLLAQQGGEWERVPHFCYVDEGLQSTDRFATYLEQYSALLNALSAFRVIYIAQHPGLIPSAQRVFSKFWDAGNATQTTTDVDRNMQELLAHFEYRRDYELQDFTRFTTDRLIAFREEKKRFSGEHYEALYRLWQTEGAHAVSTALHPGEASKDVPESRLSTYILQHNYDLFGTLTARGKGQLGETEAGTDIGTQSGTEP